MLVADWLLVAVMVGNSSDSLPMDLLGFTGQKTSDDHARSRSGKRGSCSSILVSGCRV